jgi:hypothetical protein
LADGSKFKGVFRDGMKNGKGIMIEKDGKRFEGYYQNDVKNGPYVLKDKNGAVLEKGNYKNGTVEK